MELCAILVGLFSMCTGSSEPYPELHALVATLSTGPVAPSDKIGYTNHTLIMRSAPGLFYLFSLIFYFGPRRER